MQVWNVPHAARWNTGRKISPKIRHLRTIAQFCRAISSQLRHTSTIGKNLNRNISSTCPHNTVNFDALAAEIGSLVWGTPANFNRFRIMALLLHRRRWTEVNQTLHDVWPSPGLVHCILHFRELLPRSAFLPGAKFTLRQSLALSYIGSVTERHSCTCLKCAARGSLEMHDPKSRQKVAILAPSHNFVGLYLRI